MLMTNVNWDKARNCNVWINNKKYIDFTSSIFCQNFGHNNPYVIKEVDKQIDKCMHAYGYTTEIQTKYIEKLKEMLGYKHILLFSTGSEATEAAIKIVQNNGYNCVGIKSAMHGRTLGSEALSGKRKAPKIDSYENIPYGALDKSAFFIEGYRGYDCKQLNKTDIENINNLQKNNNLIIFDEIQSGFYRTNEMFIHQYYKINPDILLIGKSMGGGFPLSAICYNKDFNLDNIELTSTHSGQPLQMAAGYGILKYIENEFDRTNYWENIKIMDKFFSELKMEHNNLGMVGAIKVDDEDDDGFYKNCFDNGLLVTKTGKGWIKKAPPVVISNNKLNKGLDIIRKFYEY
jgi:acetylornithine/N-succinyldiaminopimelate aminotransferase